LSASPYLLPSSLSPPLLENADLFGVVSPPLAPVLVLGLTSFAGEGDRLNALLIVLDKFLACPRGANPGDVGAGGKPSGIGEGTVPIAALDGDVTDRSTAPPGGKRLEEASFV